MDDDLHGLGQDLVTTSARVVRWVPKSEGLNLSLAAIRILARLNDAGPTRISDLATAERCSQPTITNHVKRLESMHLVDREPDPRDARAWMIGLSPIGLEQLAAIRGALGTSMEPYLAQLSRRDLKALREGIEAMHRLLALDVPTDPG